MTFIPIIKNKRIADFTRNKKPKQITIKSTSNDFSGIYCRNIIPLCYVDAMGNGICISYDEDDTRIPEVLYFKGYATGYAYHDILYKNNILYRNNKDLYLQNNPEIPDTKTDYWHYNKYSECSVITATLYYDMRTYTGNWTYHNNIYPLFVSSTSPVEYAVETSTIPVQYTYSNSYHRNLWLVAGFIGTSPATSYQRSKFTANNTSATSIKAVDRRIVLPKTNDEGFYYAAYFCTDVANNSISNIPYLAPLTLFFNNV